MDAFNNHTNFLFVSDENDYLAQFPVSTTSLSIEQAQFTAAWSQQPIPTSPFYDHINNLPVQQSVHHDFHAMTSGIAGAPHLMTTEGSLTESLTQSPCSPQHVIPEPTSEIKQAPSPQATGGALQSNVNMMNEACSLTTEHTGHHVVGKSHEEDQFSWSASSSPSSTAADQSKCTSWPRDAPAMQKKSSATQCELCDKWVVDMKKHRESHEETRTAKCPLTICAYTAKGMSRINDIKRHVVAQHWTQGLFCVFCTGARGEPGLHFEKAQAFRTHMRNTHGVQNRGTRDALKMPEVFKADGDHARCQVCRLEMKNYQHLHDHLESCIRRQLVIAQDVDENNARNLGNIPSPQLSSASETAARRRNTARAFRPLKRSSPHDSTLPLHESINAGNIGSADEVEYPSSWQVQADGLTIMHRTITTYNGPDLTHKESMLYQI